MQKRKSGKEKTKLQNCLLFNLKNTGERKENLPNILITALDFSYLQQLKKVVKVTFNQLNTLTDKS